MKSWDLSIIFRQFNGISVMDRLSFSLSLFKSKNCMFSKIITKIILCIFIFYFLDTSSFIIVFCIIIHGIVVLVGAEVICGGRFDGRRCPLIAGNSVWPRRGRPSACTTWPNTHIFSMAGMDGQNYLFLLIFPISC